MTEVSASIRNTVLSNRESKGSTSESGQITSLDEKVAEIPDAGPMQPPSSGNEVATTTVVVQPGETLSQIALRAVGQFNAQIVGQIRELNPDIADSNHIEPGQEIRLPRLSPRLDAPPASHTTISAGTN
jgi:nucleoid-associated protein YgaU